MKAEIGDLIQLTGSSWKTYGTAEYGRIVLVIALDDDGDPLFKTLDGSIDEAFMSISGINELNELNAYAYALVSKVKK